MKKEVRFYAALVVLISALLFIDRQFVRDQDALATRILPVEEFDSLKINWPCTVYITSGEENTVILEGKSRMLERIDASLKNGVLTIERKGLNRIITALTGSPFTGGPVNIYIQLARHKPLIVPGDARVIKSLDYQEFETWNDPRASGRSPLRLLAGHIGRALAQLRS